MPEQQPARYRWKKLLLLSQSGDTGATLKLLDAFRFLLYYEAARSQGPPSQRAYRSPDYKKKNRSKLLLLFLQFITDFRDFSLPDAKLPANFQRYVRALTQELDDDAAQFFLSAPSNTHVVDYATEVERIGIPFRQFPQDMLRIKQTAFVFQHRSKTSYHFPRQLPHKKPSWQCFLLQEQNKQKRAYKIMSIIFILR